jgi:hypothetical protein
MILRDGESFLELGVTEQVPAGTQGVGDTRFEIGVHMAGSETSFSAQSWAWVELPELVEFTRKLRQLEESRQGEAFLESMSPGEFALQIRIVDNVGHVGAFGTVAHSCYAGIGGPHRSEVTFGIPFHSDSLPEQVREFGSLVAAYDEGGM